MSVTEIASEVVRIVNTHGLAKDVIDLLEKKLALIVEENAMLSQKVLHLETQVFRLKAQVSYLEAQVSILEAKNVQLRQQLQHPKPVRKLTEPQREVLSQLMQNDAGLTVEEIAERIGDGPSMARHHCEELASFGFVAPTRFSGGHRRADGSDWGFALTKEGRSWMAQQPA